MARKPLIGTVASNVQRFGTGALNIDGCRIQTDEALRTGAGRTWDAMHANEGRGRDGEASAARRYAASGATNSAATPGQRGGDPAGRWPANLVHDGSDEVLAVFPDSAGQSGAVTGAEPSSPFKNAYGDMGRSVASLPRGDNGNAARFFYCAKADREDRNWGCEGVEPTKVHGPSGDGRCWDIPGSHSTPRANNHPTVKPHDLMRWLCRLVTPPGGLILDPFTGSGSTGRAARAEGFRFNGIELDPAYAAIANARIHATQPAFAFANAEAQAVA